MDGGSQGENPVGVSKQKKASSCDMSPDWSCDMDIQSTVSSIVGHLMSKELDLPTDVREEREERRRVDPKRAMERRHKRVGRLVYLCDQQVLINLARNGCGLLIKQLH